MHRTLHSRSVEAEPDPYHPLDNLARMVFPLAQDGKSDKEARETPDCHEHQFAELSEHRTKGENKEVVGECNKGEAGKEDAAGAS